MKSRFVLLLLAIMFVSAACATTEEQPIDKEGIRQRADEAGQKVGK